MSDICSTILPNWFETFRIDQNSIFHFRLITAKFAYSKHKTPITFFVVTPKCRELAELNPKFGDSTNFLYSKSPLLQTPTTITTLFTSRWIDKLGVEKERKKEKKGSKKSCRFGTRNSYGRSRRSTFFLGKTGKVRRPFAARLGSALITGRV